MGSAAGKAVDIGSRKLEVKQHLFDTRFSSLFLAKDVKTREMFIIKRTVAPHTDRLYNDVLVWESTLYKKLSGHPFLVSCVGIKKLSHDNGDSEALLVLENCIGGSLRDLLRTERMELSEILICFAEICEAVMHLHSQKIPIAHLDLRPENIFLHESGVWKVSNLSSSISPPIKAESEAEKNLLFERILRTTSVEYRSPEMIDLTSPSQIGLASDIWSLGCILFFLLYRSEPFGKSEDKIVNAEIMYPEFPRYPSIMNQFIVKLLCVDPTKRPNIEKVIRMIHVVVKQLADELGVTAEAITTLALKVGSGSSFTSVSGSPAAADPKFGRAASYSVSSASGEVSAASSSKKHLTRTASSKELLESSASVLLQETMGFGKTSPFLKFVEEKSVNSYSLGSFSDKDASVASVVSPQAGSGAMGFGGSSSTSPAGGVSAPLLPPAPPANAKQIGEWVTKATSSEAVAPKAKHIRNLIIDGWEKQTISFALHCLLSKSASLQTVLRTNPVVAFKTLQVLHKLMLEGPPNGMKEALEYRSELRELYNEWKQVGLITSAGTSISGVVSKDRDKEEEKVILQPLICDYLSFLAQKLKYHKEFSLFEGNYAISLWIEDLNSSGFANMLHIDMFVEVVCDALKPLFRLGRMLIEIGRKASTAASSKITSSTKRDSDESKTYSFPNSVIIPVLDELNYVFSVSSYLMSLVTKFLKPEVVSATPTASFGSLMSSYREFFSAYKDLVDKVQFLPIVIDLKRVPSLPKSLPTFEGPSAYSALSPASLVPSLASKTDTLCAILTDHLTKLSKKKEVIKDEAAIGVGPGGAAARRKLYHKKIHARTDSAESGFGGSIGKGTPASQAMAKVAAEAAAEFDIPEKILESDREHDVSAEPTVRPIKGAVPAPSKSKSESKEESKDLFGAKEVRKSKPETTFDPMDFAGLYVPPPDKKEPPKSLGDPMAIFENLLGPSDPPKMKKSSSEQLSALVVPAVGTGFGKPRRSSGEKAPFNPFVEEEKSKSSVIDAAAASAAAMGSDGSPTLIADSNPFMDLKDSKEMDSGSLTMTGFDDEIEWEELVLGERIGIGGFAEVFKAEWRGTEVAVKKLLLAKATEETITEFQSEVNIMRKLRHPNIVMFMGAVTKPPNICLVTELLQMSLFDLLHNTKLKLTWKIRSKIMLDTATGMNFLHKSKPVIIHRDLKSANLLLDKHYGVKVSDFGLSRVKAMHYTMTGQCGTFQWMAPEVIASERYTEKADVYSYGMILWELVARQIPFQGMNGVQVSVAVVTKNFRPDIPEDTPPEVAQLIKDCWDINPEARPSFEQIILRLRKMKTTLPM